jgi:hypothetical protein
VFSRSPAKFASDIAAVHQNVVNPETISLAAAVLGVLLIGLMGIGGFGVLAQRRLRSIGMLAAQGATERNIRHRPPAPGVGMADCSRSSPLRA